MSQPEAHQAPPVKPKKKKGKLIVLLLLVAFLGGGGFYAYSSGAYKNILSESADDPALPAVPQIAFIPMDRIVVSLQPGTRNRHLMVSATLEVEAPLLEDVTNLKPRIADIMNVYLRSLTNDQLEEPAALVKIRSQILRKIRLDIGEGKVRDFLITEYVMN